MGAPRACPACDAPLRETARFCHRCGAPVDGAAPRPAGAGVGGPWTALPWAVAGIALLSLAAFVVGRSVGRPRGAPAAVVTADGRIGAPDLSQLGPQERADRLFERVMTYVGEGQGDSVAFFAPMAIASQLAVTPLDAHRRYDIGLLGMVSGDGAMARAQADTILREQPDHLLGLVLAMRTAGMRGDATTRAAIARRLESVAARERARRLPEYLAHEPDIAAALRETARPPIPDSFNQ